MAQSHAYKSIVLGAAATGKTAIALRACEDTFSAETQSTIGVEYLKKEINVNGKILRISIWDTAGGIVTRTLFTGARGIFLVYDITRKKSFDEVPSWYNDVKDRVPKDTPMFLVGNKCDLESQREVPSDEGDRYAKANGMLFIETSAKESTNVEKAFEWLGQKILEVEEAREAQQNASANSATAAAGSGAVRVNPQEADAAAAAGGKVDLSKPKNGGDGSSGKSGCRC